MRKSSFTNIVGYNTINVVKGSTTAFGVQFENVADADAGIPVKSLVTVAAPYGAQKIGPGGDQIWTYTGYEWIKYFYYAPNSRKPAEGYWVLSTDTEHKELGDDIVLKTGQSFFFVRSSSSDSSITMAGGVATLTGLMSYDVAKGATTAMAYPWPEAMKIKDFTKFNSAPYGAQKIGPGGDQIWTYTGYEWIKYFYYAPNSRKPAEGYWVLSTDTEHKELGDDVTVNPGSAFFFVRSSSSAATISFSRD